MLCLSYNYCVRNSYTTNMKGDFVIKFIGAVINTGKELNDMWNWQPLSYKGVRISGPRPSRVGYSDLKRRGIIKELPRGRFKFTRKGRAWFRGSLLKYYRDLNIKWDKKWRVVIFDIPQEMHRERNRFRVRLKSRGFYMIQKSVFVFPYPCEEELADYCHDLKISDHVNILTAESLGSTEKEVKKFFVV